MSPPPASMLECWLGWLCTGLRHMAALSVRIQGQAMSRRLYFIAYTPP